MVTVVVISVEDAQKELLLLTDTSVADLPARRRRTGGRATDGAARVAGRVLLWACIALVFVRGLGAIASTPSHASADRSRGASFPSAEADVFAVRFADAYLSFSPGNTWPGTPPTQLSKT
jgi:hypothetical protein